LAREQDAAAFDGGQSATPTASRKRAPAAKTRCGLVTPHGSPKIGAKRKSDSSDEEFTTPRRTTRKAARNIKYEEPSSDSEDEDEESGMRAKVEDEDFDNDDDEYKPGEEQDGDEMDDEADIELKHEVEDVGELPVELEGDGGMEVSGVVEAGEVMHEAIDVGDASVMEEVKVEYSLGDPFMEPAPQKELKIQVLGCSWN